MKVVLVNPISERGHLDAYARLYSRAFLELGCKVMLVAGGDGGAPYYLARNCPESVDRFRFVSFDSAEAWTPVSSGWTARDPTRHLRSPYRRALLVWREEGLLGLARRLYVVPRRKLSDAMPQPVKERLRAIRAKITARYRQWLDADARRLSFEHLLRRVEGAAALAGTGTPDLVFFLYLDLMSEKPTDVALLDIPGLAPWVGILFHPRLASSNNSRIENYFNSSRARGGVFLVPSAIAAYHRVSPRLRFVLAPDVADLELAERPPPLADEIRRRAAGRTIVLQIGSITPHKGIMTLVDVIAKADPAHLFFALVGEAHWESFGPHARRLRAFFAAPPENVLVNEGYLSNERDYNSVVSTTDVIYAVYHRFQSSSNALTKAAGLKRPILVSAGTLMGERVLASGIGAVAPEDDAARILAALTALAEEPKDKFTFDDYLCEHSLEALKSVLAEALPRWCTLAPLGTKTNACKDDSA